MACSKDKTYYCLLPTYVRIDQRRRIDQLSGFLGLSLSEIVRQSLDQAFERYDAVMDTRHGCQDDDDF